MASGKYEKKGMAGRKTGRLVLILCLALLINCTIGGTIAFIVTKSNSVQNTFERVSVTSSVVFEGDVAKVKNEGDVDAYVRAAIVVNWMDDNGDVRGIPPTADEYSLGINTDDWYYDSGLDIYYYKESVPSFQMTEALVESITVKGAVPAGYKLTVEVVAEAIQAQGQLDNGKSAFADAWGISTIGG